ncbi:aminoacyl-tRNA hydrolase [Pendulispora brunnea]|uniref:Peptidyl-tRNA hydrolase n=1 Tax=Pendulispora brunnea TaxID=2905690 RepID=A0ABZ2KMW9_9BACT
MILVVGLGNPGKKYAETRHNIGFMVADEIHRQGSFPEWREKFSGVFTKGTHNALLKPQTFMNLSGDSVQPCAAFLKAEPAEIIVIHDELDLPWGDVRLKFGGGHAGHNGLRSIIGRLGTPDFVRVRVGIGRPPPDFRGDVADYVLTGFDPVERAELPNVVETALKAAHSVVMNGMTAAMNTVNTRGKRA